MKLRDRLERRVGALQREPGADLRRCDIGPPASDDDIAVVRHLAGPVPQALLALYREMNGVTLSWTWKRGDQASIGGSLNVLPLRAAMLGVSPLPDGEPCEGMLWNSDFPAAALRRLKSMRVLESVAGEPAFIAFRPHRRPLQFHLVEETSVQGLATSAEETLALLVDHLGCEDLRQTLTHDDWRRRLRGSPCCMAVAGL